MLTFEQYVERRIRNKKYKIRKELGHQVITGGKHRNARRAKFFKSEEGKKLKKKGAASTALSQVHRLSFCTKTMAKTKKALACGLALATTAAENPTETTK